MALANHHTPLDVGVDAAFSKTSLRNPAVESAFLFARVLLELVFKRVQDFASLNRFPTMVSKYILPSAIFVRLPPPMDQNILCRPETARLLNADILLQLRFDEDWRDTSFLSMTLEDALQARFPHLVER